MLNDQEGWALCGEELVKACSKSTKFFPKTDPDYLLVPKRVEDAKLVILDGLEYFWCQGRKQAVRASRSRVSPRRSGN